MILTIDGATSDASLAVVRDEEVFSIRWNVGRRHSVEMPARIEWILDQCHADAQQIEAFGVTLGPGSFNGVRAAMGLAKTLGFALNRPLYGHTTLDIAAWGVHYVQGDIIAIQEAGHRELFVGRYHGQGASPEAWRADAEYLTLTPEALVSHVSRPVTICGNWRQETRTVLEQFLRVPYQFVSPVGTNRAELLAELVIARMRNGSPDDAASIEPVYLRRPNITKGSQVAMPRWPSEDLQESASTTLREL